MRDLDRRASRHRVAVEAQQAVAPERVEHPLDPTAIVDLLDLDDQGPPAGHRPGAVVVEVDESEEHMPGGLGGLGAEPGEQRVGSPGQRP